MAPVGLQTSGRELREMLQKSGLRLKTEGAEKLDFLVWLADQVKGSIEEQRKMHLTLSELGDFLRREQLDSRQLDAKGAVSGLLALRRRELRRLSYDESRVREMESKDACFEQALMRMPAKEVAGCFGTDVAQSPKLAAGSSTQVPCFDGVGAACSAGAPHAAAPPSPSTCSTPSTMKGRSPAESPSSSSASPCPVAGASSASSTPTRMSAEAKESKAAAAGKADSNYFIGGDDELDVAEEDFCPSIVPEVFTPVD